MKALHPEILIRHPGADDLHITFDLLMRCKIPEYGLDGLRDEWSGMDLPRQAWLAFTGDGSLVGYATATPYHSGLCYHVYVDPTWEDIDVNRLLLQECDRWGKMETQLGAQLGKDFVTTWNTGGNERDQQAIEEAGFWLVKRTFLMCIEMQHHPPEPQWPESIKVRSVIPGQDDRAICHLMAAVFEGTHLEPTNFDEWINGMIGGTYFDPDLWFVAVHEDGIIGTCICAVYPDTQEAWVRQLGVSKKWQRCGVGRALMQHALVKFYRKGHKTVRIGVEADTAAHRLYEQVGMRTIQQYDEYQKKVG
jgi:GNAT superfamily N-acetyltransferase